MVCLFIIWSTFRNFQKIWQIPYLWVKLSVMKLTKKSSTFYIIPVAIYCYRSFLKLRIFVPFYVDFNVLKLPFSSTHTFRIHSKFSNFSSRYCIFSVKRYYFWSLKILAILALLFVKLMQHMWFGIYQIYTQHTYSAILVQKIKFWS